jgi:hypothetical protein
MPDAGSGLLRLDPGEVVAKVPSPAWVKREDGLADVHLSA